MTYLDKINNDKFLGDGSKNNAGQDLNTFLENYDPKKYMNPCNTVDNIILAYDEESGEIKKVLLIKRGNHPSIGWWALPGGFVEYREDLALSAARELQEETGIEGLQMMQIKTYGEPGRDPRTRIITTAYAAIVPLGKINAAAGDDAADAAWFTINTSLISKERDGEMEIYLYNLILRSEEKQITTVSKIKVTTYPDRILSDDKYEAIDTEELAADHGAVILEGLHIVNSKIRDAKIAGH